MQSHKHEEHHGYIVPVSYSGQQGSGIQAFISLQCWMSSFNLPMHLLEPVMLNNIFPISQNTSDSMKFSDLFDIHNFNRVSETLGYPIVATRKEFFSAAQRETILMMKHIMAHQQVLSGQLIQDLMERGTVISLSTNPGRS